MGRTLRIEPLGRTIAVEEHQALLLEAAPAQGLQLRSDCRSDNCRECIARVAKGRMFIRWSQRCKPHDRRVGFALRRRDLAGIVRLLYMSGGQLGDRAVTRHLIGLGNDFFDVALRRSRRIEYKFAFASWEAPEQMR